MFIYYEGMNTRSHAPDPGGDAGTIDGPSSRVRLARDAALDPGDLSLLADRFKLLADPGRLAMIYALLEAGEMSVGDLAVAVEASESGTSHQLRLLRQGGLVRSRPEGRSVYYRVADTHIRLLLDVAVEHYLHGHGGDA